MCLFQKCQILSFILSACICTGSFGADQDTYLLQAVYRPGEETYLEVQTVLQQDFVNDALGPLMKTNFRQVTGVLEKVISANQKDGAELQLTFDRVVQRVSAMQELWEYDSDGAKNDMMLKRVMAPLIGQKVKMRIDAAGKPISLTGMDPIVVDMELASVEDPASAQFFGQIKANLSDAAQKFLWADMSLGLLPNRRVKIGDTWQVTLRQPVVYVGDVVRQYTCTFEAVEDQNGHQVARIGYQAKCEIAPDAQNILAASGLAMEYVGGTVIGGLLFDIDLSLVVSQEEQLESTQTTETPHPDGLADAQRMRIEQTQTTRLRRVSSAMRATQRKRHAQGRQQRRTSLPPQTSAEPSPDQPEQ